jgi:hypothetical protein
MKESSKKAGLSRPFQFIVNLRTVVPLAGTQLGRGIKQDPSCRAAIRTKNPPSLVR